MYAKGGYGFMLREAGCEARSAGAGVLENGEHFALSTMMRHAGQCCSSLQYMSMSCTGSLIYWDTRVCLFIKVLRPFSSRTSWGGMCASTLSMVSIIQNVHFPRNTLL